MSFLAETHLFFSHLRWLDPLRSFLFGWPCVVGKLARNSGVGRQVPALEDTSKGENKPKHQKPQTADQCVGRFRIQFGKHPSRCPLRSFFIAFLPSHVVVLFLGVPLLFASRRVFLASPICLACRISPTRVAAVYLSSAYVLEYGHSYFCFLGSLL